LIYSKRIDHPNALRCTDIEKNGFFGVNPKEFLSQPIPEKTKFCSFIFFSKNPNRENFCKELSRYKKVDCLGKRLNNAISPTLTKRYSTDAPLGVGIGISNVETIKPYKFNICFERLSLPGYLTEKIWWGFLARTISLYWGDPTVYESFNKGSFLYRGDYPNDRAFINAIKELDNDDTAYYNMLNTNPIKDLTLIDPNHLIMFVRKIYESVCNKNKKQ